MRASVPAHRRLAVLLAAGTALLVAAPAARGAVEVEVSDRSVAAVRDHWTPERMRSAAAVAVPQVSGAPLQPAGKAASPPGAQRATVIRPTSGVLPVDFEPGSETSFPQRVHGRVFFSIPGLGDASCSGTLVASLRQNVVFTAGHCAYDNDTRQWVANLAFVPAYRDGAAPFGVFPAAALLAPEEWTQHSHWSYDMAIAQLAVPLEEQLGARGVAFNRAPRTTYQIFGYPGQPAPYNGERLIECNAPFLALEYTGSYPFSTVAFPCNMQQGASGGGWVNPEGEVTSVSSHVYADPSLDDMIVGPYFGPAAKRLYNRAGGSAQCPPAKQRLAKARKRAKEARRRMKRARRQSAERRAAGKVRKARRMVNRARLVRDRYC